MRFQKLIYTLLIAFFGSIAMPSLQAQTIDETVVKDLKAVQHYALGVQSTREIKGAIMTMKQMQEAGITVEHFEVVIWGKVIKELGSDSEMAEFIRKNASEEMSFSVCAMAMKKLEVSRDEIMPEIGVVPNAYVRLFQLQAKGYNTILP
tara:strand:+ start:978 stop:1424 length:447 start_codon:yes stop_codon:yes gene_type:complete